MSDDGLGSYVIKKLQEDPHISDEIILLDGGTQGLDLMPFIDGMDHVIIIDAILSTQLPPGSLLTVEHENILKILGQKMSVHEIGIIDLLCALSLLDKEPKQLKLIGLVPKSLEFAYGITPLIQEHTADVIQAIHEQIATWHNQDIKVASC